MENNKNKILWLSILQGWAMLWVVIGHANMWEQYCGGSVYDYDWLHIFAYCFHMPLFMFTSGGLFYMTRINRDMHYKDVIWDKIKRLLIPCFFFTTFCFLLKASLSQFMKRGVQFTWHDFIYSFLVPSEGPLIEMWFIDTLFILMLFYPLYKFCCKRQLAELLLLISAFLIFFFVKIDSKLFNIYGVPEYFLYFVVGILFFKYQLEKYFRNIISLLIITVIFALTYYMFGRILPIIPFCGILFSVCISLQLGKYLPSAFSSFRDYSFQIFLIGIYPQMLIELFLWKRLFCFWAIIPLYVVSVLSAIYVSVIVSKSLENKAPKFLKTCFGLK